MSRHKYIVEVDTEYYGAPDAVQLFQKVLELVNGSGSNKITRLHVKKVRQYQRRSR